MKKSILTLTFAIWATLTFGQVDSISFSKNPNVEIKSTSVDEIKINKTTIKTSGETTKYLSINEKCNYILPKYSELTGVGTFNFKRIKSDAQASLSALGSSLSVDKKSDYYVFYFSRTKTFSCPENTQENKTSFGVGVFIVFKVSELKVKLDIKTPYDISAAAHLGLAKVELDVRTFGMTPELQNEFIPETLSKIDIEAAKYFDKVMSAARTKINDQNTVPNLLPIEL